MPPLRVRPARQAGRFYPADEAELRSVVEQDLDKAEDVSGGEPVYGLVSPHAGYRFSGPTAGWAWRQVFDREYTRLVVLAPSHSAQFQGVALFEGDAFHTPIGDLAVDRSVDRELREQSVVPVTSSYAHNEEHSLEVQLPFAQVALGAPSLTAILIGDPRPENCAEVADALKSALDAAGARPGEDTLIAASSDLYHGPSADDCEATDRRLVDELERFQPESFLAQAARRDIMACGAGPIGVMMRVVRAAGATRMRVVHRTNSYREYPVHSDYVVGYLAAIAQ